ncbi:zinc finger matrin-type protein 3 [Rhincodon typus]|uniref:zinc finger matrin-type protein 3 n=1 Tax=Rhincodon typus TaxID=259920 RepID=UPI00202DD663|nr:zinc finger matrin-type protein 3 [Rhincodon typus]
MLFSIQSGSSKTAGRVILATANDYCKLCDASFSSPAVAQAHYQGKNHAKRLRLAEAQKSNSFLEATELTKRRPRKEGNEFKIVPNRRNLHGVQNTLGPYSNPRSRQRIPRDLAMCVTPSGQFYCSMCNIGASEEQEFRLHLESKLHKSKVSEQRYRNEMENLGYA